MLGAREVLLPQISTKGQLCPLGSLVILFTVSHHTVTPCPPNLQTPRSRRDPQSLETALQSVMSETKIRTDLDQWVYK